MLAGVRAGQVTSREISVPLALGAAALANCRTPSARSPILSGMEGPRLVIAVGCAGPITADLAWQVASRGGTPD